MNTHSNCSNLLCYHPSAPINIDDDSMFFNDPDALFEFGRQLHARGLWSCAHGDRARARELFPTRPRGYVAATLALSHYAANKATAMRCRLRGDITAASIYERICEDIYGRLPDFAKW